MFEIHPQKQHHSQLRLALNLALYGSTFSALYTIAVVCSTWSAINLGASKRDLLTPYGDVSVASVRSANRMVARTGSHDVQFKLLTKKYFQWLQLLHAQLFQLDGQYNTYQCMIPIPGRNKALDMNTSQPPINIIKHFSHASLARVSLMVVFLHFLGHNFLIENPARSTLLLRPWLRWAVSTIQNAGGKVSQFGQVLWVGGVKFPEVQNL